MANISYSELFTTMTNKLDRDLGNVVFESLRQKVIQSMTLDTPKSILRMGNSSAEGSTTADSFGIAPFNGFAFTACEKYSDNTFVIWEKINALWYPMMGLRTSSIPMAQFPITKGREYCITFGVQYESWNALVGVGVQTPIGSTNGNIDKKLIMTPYMGEV